MHTHLLSASFHVRSVSPSFLVANGAVAAGQITRLYNSGAGAVEERGGLGTRAASIHLRPVEVSDEQGVFYLHGALGADRVGGGLELKRRVVTTCEVLKETVLAQGE